MFQHCESLQQNLLCHKQLITEQSIRLKELEIQFKSLADRNDDLNDIQEIPILPGTGFRKNKKPLNKQISNLQRQARSQSNKKARPNQYESNLQSSYRSHSFEKGFDEAFIQQIKNLIQTNINQMVGEQNKAHTLNINNIKQEMSKKIGQLEIKYNKEIIKIEQNLNDNLESKIREAQKQLANKNQIERANMIRFIQQNAVQTQKLWQQFTDLHNRMNQFVQQNKLCYSNPIYLKPQKQNELHYKTKKTTDKNNQIDRIQQNKNESKIYQLFCNLHNQFKQFKLKIIKDCADFMKVQQVQSILTKYQKQIGDRISKINTSIAIFQKQYELNKKQTLTKNQSRISIPIFKAYEQQQKNRLRKGKSQQSIKQIYESMQKIQSYFKQKLKIHKKQLSAQIDKKLEQHGVRLLTQMKQQMQYRQKSMCEIVQTSCDKVVKYQQRGGSADVLRNTVQKLADQMILARYLHFGERQSRQFIQWEKNIITTMEENYVWKTNNPTVQVISSGLYRVEVGLYPENGAETIEAYLLLNGEPISSLKHKQVPLNSKAMSRGSLFNQAILIPAKSKLAIKVELPFFGQAYMQILKL